MNLWPGLLSLDLAAKYCSMKPVEFLKAVAIGDLPQPVLIDGKTDNAELIRELTRAKVAFQLRAIKAVLGEVG